MGHEAQAGAERFERRRALEHGHVRAGLAQRHCGGEPADPGSHDDGAGHGRIGVAGGLGVAPVEPRVSRVRPPRRVCGGAVRIVDHASVAVIRGLRSLVVEGVQHVEPRGPPCRQDRRGDAGQDRDQREAGQDRHREREPDVVLRQLLGHQQ